MRPYSIDAVLEKMEIHVLEKDIFRLSKAKLYETFAFKNGGMNSSSLIKSLIYQDSFKFKTEELPPIRGNIRSYWYARIKPVLGRARAKKYSQKYGLMIRAFSQLIQQYHLFSYGTFSFVDSDAHQRRLGGVHRQVFVVAEKVGHLALLRDIAAVYDVTIISLGGQPSALSTEYLVKDMKAAGMDVHAAIVLMSIVDYDPAGAIILKSFIKQLRVFGMDGDIKVINLAHPDRLPLEDIKLNRYPLSRTKREDRKNRAWINRGGGLERYSAGKFFGLEADAMGWKGLWKAFEEEVEPYLTIPRKQLERRRLKLQLLPLLKELLLQKILTK